MTAGCKCRRHTGWVVHWNSGQCYGNIDDSSVAVLLRRGKTVTGMLIAGGLRACACVQRSNDDASAVKDRGATLTKPSSISSRLMLCPSRSAASISLGISTLLTTVRRVGRLILVREISLANLLMG